MRRAVKSVVMAVMFVLVLPSGLFARLVHRLLGSHLLFNFFAHIYAVAPGLPGTYARVCYYKQTLKRAALDDEFAFGSVVTKADAEIGHRVYVGLYSSVGLVDIGDDTVLANYVSILSGSRQHNFEDPDQPIFNDRDTFSRVTIGANSFFGDKATVMANVGNRSIVGAGAVVTKDIPDYVIAVGNPAKVIRDRRPSTSQEKTESTES